MGKYGGILLKTFVALCIAAGFGAMLLITLPYLSFQTDIGFLLTKQTVLHVKIWRASFYAHIISSPFILLAGLFQFMPGFVKPYAALHRNLGRMYVLLILLVSAPAGLVMSVYANGGLWAKISFVLLSCLWWWFTYMAFKKIKAGHVNTHVQFITRSYALTLAALTLRFYVLILPQFFHFPAKEMYILVSWLSWVPNLLIAEWLIRKNRFPVSAAAQFSPQQ